jgi:hypothetical protein
MQQPGATTGGKPEQLVSRSAKFTTFDLGATIRASLRGAELGDPVAQYRAAVLLRECQNARMTEADFERLGAAGVVADHVSAMKQTVKRCEAVTALVPGDIGIVSRQWFEAARRQNFALSIASDLALKDGPVRPNELDSALKNALSVAGDDLTLRSEAFLLVLAAMDKHTVGTYVDPDTTVRNAWTLLHCRETRACDLDETVAYLRKDLMASDMQQSIALMNDIDGALSEGKIDGVRLY